MMSAQVRDAGEDQQRAVVVQDHVFILENPQPERLISAVQARSPE